MDLWQELFGVVGWWALPLIVASWAFREWWEVRKHRDQAKMTRLAEVRAAKIQGFYGKLRRTEDLLNDLYYLYMPIGIDPPQVDPKAAVQQMRDLEKTAKEQEIYFSAELSAAMKGMCQALSDATHALERREILIQTGGRGTQEESEVEKKAFEILKDTVPEIRGKLEEEFRHLLGSK